MGQSRAPKTQFLQRYALLSFFVLAFALTWAYWIPQALSSRDLLQASVPEFLAIVAGYGPALAALIVTWFVSGRSGVRELMRRLILWRVGIRWYAVALLLPAAQTLTALGFSCCLAANASCNQAHRRLPLAQRGRRFGCRSPR